MIIDAHCHAEENEAGWNHPPELLIDLMDKAGVDISYITTYGEYPYMENAGELLVSYCRKYPGRLYGFVRINPNGGEKGNEYLRRLVKKYPEEIRGVKLHPISNGLKPYHPNCLKLFHTCAELDIPLFTPRVCTTMANSHGSKRMSGHAVCLSYRRIFSWRRNDSRSTTVF